MLSMVAMQSKLVFMQFSSSGFLISIVCTHSSARGVFARTVNRGPVQYQVLVSIGASAGGRTAAVLNLV